MSRFSSPGTNRKTPWLVIGGVAIVLVAIVALVIVGLGRNRGTPASPDPTSAPAVDTNAQTTTGSNSDMPQDPAARNGMYSAAPAMEIDTSKQYFATIKTENGDIVIQLFADKAPNTVNNFVFLARQGFYDNTTFHRVIEGFMAQGGDPTGTGTGGPGYTFADETDPSLTFDGAGVVAMANAGPNTNGSQFFITFAAAPWLNGSYSIFGKVVEGTDVVNQIKMRDPQTATTPGTLIGTIEITEK